MTTRDSARSALSTCILLGICLASTSVDAADWPGLLDPNRDGHSPDQRLLKQWPEAGPPLLCKVDDIGPGWSSIAVVGGRIYTTGNADGMQMLICLDIDGTGRSWAHPVVIDGRLLLRYDTNLYCYDVKAQ